ncbi:hypothetical protein [Micromonospora sp. NPDC050695]|uniref:hypothetical protein n=1 Tax=Micromonospora sp. NPDC050695 TaxID=3154938 RepID=UPI0033EFC428
MIAEAGMSHAEVARALVRVAQESNVDELTGVGRSHVSHWIAGSKPSGRAPVLLCEALSRKLGRALTLEDIGLPTPLLSSSDMLGWRVDTLAALTELGRVASMTVGKGDVDAVQDMVSLFSRVDQRRGGGHARSAVVQYLSSDVASYLCGRYVDEKLRRDMFSAASELSYLAGWMAFDNGEHNVAQHYFTVAVKLAAEADNPAMAGHVLRAMAHQAIDLGHHKHALDLANASVHGDRYETAAPRERALIGVVHARALAVNGETQSSARALLRAEDDLAAAQGDDEPAEPVKSTETFS